MTDDFLFNENDLFEEDYIEDVSETLWVRFSGIKKIVYMGYQEGVLVTWSSSIAKFYELGTKMENVFAANTMIKDGIGCLAAHPELPIWAFSQKRHNPHLEVVDYPDLKIINSLIERDTETFEYVDLAFVGWELLVAQAGIPHAKITVWNWKTSELIYAFVTNFIYHHLALRAPMEYIVPGVLTWAMYSFLKNKFFVWELYCVGKVWYTQKWNLELPNDEVTDMIWSSVTLYIIGSYGDIYQLEADKTVREIYHNPDRNEVEETKHDKDDEVERKTFLLSIYKNDSFYVFSPGNIGRVYIFENDQWKMKWESLSQCNINSILFIPKKKELYAASEYAELMLLTEPLIENDTPWFQTVYDLGNAFISIQWVNPIQDFILALSEFKKLLVIEKNTGNIVNVGLDNLENCLDIVSCPKHSYVVLCQKDGQLDFYKIYLNESFQMISTLNVSESPLDTGKFNSEATLFVTCNFETTKIFVIKVSLITKPEVIGFINLNYISISLRIESDFKTMIHRVFVLKKTEECCDAGNQIDMLRLKPENVHMILEKSFHFKESYHSLENLPNTSVNSFIGMPHRTFDIYITEFRGERSFLISKHKSGHQLRYCQLALHEFNKNILFTWSIDGDIFVHSIPSFKKIGFVSTHHRYELGVLKCIIDKHCEYVVSIGKDSNVIGVKTNFPHVPYIEEVSEDSSDIMLNFKPPAPGKINISVKSWEMLQIEMKMMQEKISNALLRKKVVEGVKKIQDKAAELLEQNLAEVEEDAKLPLEDFDLDVERQANMEVEYKKMLEETEKEVHDEIERNNRKREEILKATWNKMEIHAKKIKGINTKIIVAGYSLPFMKKKFKTKYKQVIFQSKLEKLAETIFDNHFYPWVSEREIIEENVEAEQEEEEEYERRDTRTIIRDKILKEDMEGGNAGDESMLEKKSERRSILVKDEESFAEKTTTGAGGSLEGKNKKNERRSFNERRDEMERRSERFSQTERRSYYDRLSIQDRSQFEKTMRDKKSTRSERLEAELESESEMDEDDELAEMTDNYPEMDYEKFENQYSGSNAYQFVKRSPYHYTQFEMVTEGMMYKDWILSKMLIRDLSLYFNKELDNVWQEKENEIQRIKEKNERIRFLMEEINLMSRLVNDVSFVPLNPNKIIDLEWTQEEQTELMVQLQEWEVPVKPYISPSQQALLDQKAAEEEARRLALLADDFRERALMKMMNGVLEIRWEDEIKRDIPKPKCMLEKDPGDYDIEDIKTVKAYEEQVEFLMSERERYRRMCISEMRNHIQDIWENGNKFDEKILKLYDLRLKVESAIDQEKFKFYRLREECFRKMNMNEEEKKLINELETVKSEIEDLKIEASVMKKTLSDLQHLVDSFPAKEQLLNKNYKKDFHGITPYLREHLLKLYRRRPRMAPKLQEHSLQLRELVKFLLHGDKELPSYLTAEQLEVLQVVDSLDNPQFMPGQLPPELWPVFCKHRRLKMEHEIKFKCSKLDLAQSESSFAAHDRLFQDTKNKKKTIEKDIAKLRADRLELSHNKQIQIVMPSAQVEMPIKGDIGDFKDAVLIARSDIAKINKKIIAAGNKKIEVMKRAAKFKIKISKAEWQNQKLKMQIEDLKEDLYYMNHFKLTRDMRNYLILKKRGIEKDYGPETLENLRKGYAKMFEKIKNFEKKKVDKIDKLIKMKLKENEILDKKIIELNVQMNEYQLKRDLKKEEKDKKEQKKRLDDIMKVSRLTREINKAFNEYLQLNTIFNKKKLRTFPTLTPHPPDLYFKGPPADIFHNYCKGSQEK